MRVHISCRSSILSSLVTFAVVWAGIVASAQATSPQPQRNCVIVVGKGPKGKPSPVRSTTCSGDPKARSLKAAASGRTLLMEWFKHANNRPSSFIRVYGDAGPCDRDGYGLRVRGFFGISGFNTWNYCSMATGYQYLSFAGDRQTWNGTGNPCICLSVGWVGHFMNDRIQSFRIWRG